MADTRTQVRREMDRLELRPFTLGEFHARRDRKIRNERITAGVVGVAVFVAAVWLATTGGPFDRGAAPVAPRPSESTSSPYPAGLGLVGLPPKGAPPSTPERGELIVGFTFGHTPGDAGRFSFHMYADGRVIWQQLGDLEGTNRVSTGLVEQRLSPEGVQLVLAEVLSTGLLDHDRELVGASGLNYGGIQVRSDGRFVQLAWGDAGFPGGDRPIVTTPTPDQVSALERLDARLADLASWLPVSAWEQPEMRMYLPSAYQVCYAGSEDPLGRTRILHVLPAPAADLLEGLNVTRGVVPGTFGRIPYWCSVVTIEQARGLAETLQGAGAIRRSMEGPAYAYSPSGRKTVGVDISFDALLPDGPTR
jgi:hypothetical protein